MAEMKTLSRGIVCDHPTCHQYAVLEWVADLGARIGSGTMTCSDHTVGQVQDAWAELDRCNVLKAGRRPVDQHGSDHPGCDGSCGWVGINPIHEI